MGLQIVNAKPRAHRVGHGRENQRAVPIHDGGRCFAWSLGATNIQRYTRHNARTPSVFFHPHFLLCSGEAGAGLQTGAGRKAVARHLQAVPTGKEFREDILIVVPVRRALDS